MKVSKFQRQLLGNIILIRSAILVLVLAGRNGQTGKAAAGLRAEEMCKICRSETAMVGKLARRVAKGT